MWVCNLEDKWVRGEVVGQNEDLWEVVVEATGEMLLRTQVVLVFACFFVFFFFFFVFFLFLFFILQKRIWFVRRSRRSSRLLLFRYDLFLVLFVKLIVFF